MEPRIIESDSKGEGVQRYLALDAQFEPLYMTDPETGNDWFGGLTLSEARKVDLDYIASHQLDEDEAFTRVSGIMTYFTDIVADLVIAKFGQGISRWESEDYLVEHGDNSKGVQICPWQDEGWSSGAQTTVTNKKTGAKLLVNAGTAHMAEKHHILEKGMDNPYATSIESFMENFGNLPNYTFTNGRYSELKKSKK